jgi:hypothetical protein
LQGHRVLRDVPGHSRQRRRPIRQRRPGARLRCLHRRLPPSAAVAVGMSRVPRSVRLAVPRSLAVLATARALPGSDPRVRQKPSTAYATRSLLAHCAREHRRPRAPAPLRTTLTAATTSPLGRLRHAGYAIAATRSGQWVISDEQTWVISGERRRADPISIKRGRARERRGCRCHVATNKCPAVIVLTKALCMCAKAHAYLGRGPRLR